jgi:thioester reductase-like protein
MGSERIAFVTGFPGFIGVRLVGKLLEEEPDLAVVCLVERRFEFKAREEARRLGTNGPGTEPRVSVVVGDITVPGLGLDEHTMGDLAGRVTDVFHLAAATDLDVSEPLARRVNVWGTRHVIELCRKARSLQRLVHFSSCFVSGTRTGTVYEDELDMGQSFKNHLESTKHDAEYLVRQCMRELPAIIIRPPVVAGDSTTGETVRFDGPYFGMILVDKLRILRVPMPYLGESVAEVNVVPVDFVVDGTVALWRAAEPGATFALADPHPLLAREMYAEIVRGLGALGPIGQVPPLAVDLPLRIPRIRRILEVPREVLAYFNHPAHFDCSKALEALDGTGVSCPDVRSYLPALIDYYRENRGRSELRWSPD